MFSLSFIFKIKFLNLFLVKMSHKNDCQGCACLFVILTAAFGLSIVLTIYTFRAGDELRTHNTDHFLNGTSYDLALTGSMLTFYDIFSLTLAVFAGFFMLMTGYNMFQALYQMIYAEAVERVGKTIPTASQAVLSGDEDIELDER